MSPPTPEHPEDPSTDTPAQPVQLPPSAQDDAPPRLWPRRLLLAAEILALLLILITITSAIALRHAMHAALPQLDGNLSIAGLSAPVTITRDAQGVPSIHAANLDDLLFAQGYITASDRLFQMDALRRHGAGELAEILGPSLLQHDREQRILQLRAAADRAIAVLPPDQLHQLQAYARGVNAFIDTHSDTHNSHQHSPSAQDSAQDDLPIEFHILHYTPAPWTPSDSLLIALVMSQDLSTEFPTKLNREALSAHLPADLLADLYPTGSWRDHPPTQDPTNLTTPSGPVEQIPLDNTQSSISPQNGCPIHDVASSRHEWAGDSSSCPTAELSDNKVQRASSATPRDLLATYADLHSNQCEGCKAGSNNWAVAGTHTATGAPLLSNDMHLGLTAPDIWYEAALHADGPTPLDVTGFTLPGVPFVIAGRNAHVAWSFTNSGADVQDVLIEHLRGHGQNTEYEHPDHTWSPIGHQTERIRVRAGHDVTLDVLTITHTIGTTSITTPIISPLYKSEHRALALAWTIYDPATVTSPFLAIDTATDAASLVAAFASFSSVSLNLIYADAHHIGYHLLGRIPIRGPAIQRPRATQPFILPDTTPPEDEEDESGDDDPDASLIHPQLWHPQLWHPQLWQPQLWQPQLRVAHSSRGLLRDGWGLAGAGTPHLTSAKWVPSHRSHFILARATQTLSSRPERSAVERPAVLASATQTPPNQQELPTTPYTIGSPISPVPVDALDPTQAWSGYIPYDALPSVLDPTSGILATANARIVTDVYPYYIANNWGDAYRVERIHHLLESAIASGKPLTPADMLHIQTDVHSEFDLLVAQRLAYALDHSALTKKDPRLHQAADLLRDWNGDVTANSSAAAIVAAARSVLWPMLLTPQIRAHDRHTHNSLKPSPSAQDSVQDSVQDLYTWEEKTSALEGILQHTPARWLPHAFANWNDFLTTAVERGLHFANAPSNLSTWTYGSGHPIEIPHPIFGSHSPISTLLGVATGTGLHPNGGDATTIKAAGLHFGPSERFTADLSNPDDTHANLTTGESGNPSSPWYLDQFQPWLNGTTFPLPLDHPATTHTLTLNPK